MRQKRNISQIKEQDKTPEEQLSEVEIGKLPEKQFRVMIVKMIQDLRKRMDAQINKNTEQNKGKRMKRNEDSLRDL